MAFTDPRMDYQAEIAAAQRAELGPYLDTLEIKQKQIQIRTDKVRSHLNHLQQTVDPASYMDVIYGHRRRWADALGAPGRLSTGMGVFDADAARAHSPCPAMTGRQRRRAPRPREGRCRAAPNRFHGAAALRAPRDRVRRRA